MVSYSCSGKHVRMYSRHTRFLVDRKESLGCTERGVLSILTVTCVYVVVFIFLLYRLIHSNLTTGTEWPACIILAIHFYHVMAFNLNSNDIFHHALFVPVIGGIHFTYPWGCAGNVRVDFVSFLGSYHPYLTYTTNTGTLLLHLRTARRS